MKQQTLYTLLFLSTIVTHRYLLAWAQSAIGAVTSTPQCVEQGAPFQSLREIQNPKP